MRKERLDVRIDTWVTSDVAERVQRIADRDKRTVSFVVREMIDHCLGVLDPVQPPARPNGQHQQEQRHGLDL